MKKIKIKVHSDKMFAYVAMFSMVANILSPFAALLPTSAYAEDLPAEEISQQVEEEEASEPEENIPEEEAPEEEIPAEEPVEDGAEEPEEPAEPEVAVEPLEEIPADVFIVEPEVIDEEQPGDILDDGASDYRPEVDISASEAVEVPEIIDPVVEEPKEEIKEYETLADGVEIKDSVEEDWNVDGDKAETKEKVKIGIKYIFPLEEEVSITFTKLPKLDEDRSKLKIERVKVSDLNLPDDFKTSEEYAYDITTDMEDGEFEYDLTLPKPEGVDAEVSYIEKSIDEARDEVKIDDVKKVEEDKLDQEEGDSNVKISDLDHFTIFVVVSPDETIDDHSVQNQDYAWISDNQYATFNNSSDYAEYGFPSLGIPLGADIEGIEVSVEGYTTGRDLDIAIWNKSNNNPDAYTSFKEADLSSSESTVIVGGSTEKWGKTWNSSDFGTDFKVMVDARSDSSNSGTVYLDQIKVKVYYSTAPLFTPPTLNYDSSDDYALTSVSGIWTDVSGGSNVNGEDTEEVRWGNSTGYGQSGLRFDGSALQSFNEGDGFYLGALTHFNWPITNAANGATLKITLQFLKPGITPNPEFTFDFNINETPNSTPCAAWHTPGHPACDDKVTFPSIYGEESFTIGDKLYTLKINGFVNAFPGGSPVSEFITEEQKNNTAFLVGSLSSILVEAPQITLNEKAVEGDDADAAPGPSINVGDSADFTYKVQNTGNVSLTDITVVDDKGVTVTCPKTTLEPGELMTCTGSATAILGLQTNTAYATGKHSGNTYTSNNEVANYTGVSTVTCGDDVINQSSEQCDGTDLGGLSSSDYSCNKKCELTQIVDKVTICHASDSHTNPYVEEEPNKSGDVSGHADHTGDIWYPGIADHSWGDIIPPFDYLDNGVVKNFAGQNWTTEGQAIWNYDGDGNGKKCEIPPTTGTITIIKDDNIDSGQDFTFIFGGIGLTDSQFILDDDSDPTRSNTYVMSNMAPNIYDIEEQAVSGWTNDSVICSSNKPWDAPDNGGIGYNGNVSFSLIAGEDVVCTFTNTRDIGNIRFEKIVNPHYPWSEGPKWNFNLSGDYDAGGWDLTDGANGGITVPTGFYTLTETGIDGVNDANYDSSYRCSDVPADYQGIVEWTITGSGRTASFNLEAGHEIYCEFTNVEYGSISGIKFEDKNGNHVKDDDEGGLPGWTIYIDSNKNQQFDIGEPTEVTDSSGNFTFSNLLPNNYWIIEVNQAGWSQTRPTWPYQEVDLTSGEDEFIYFGNQRNASCGDGTVNGDEQCDYGSFNGQSSCSIECTWDNTCRDEMVTNGDFESPTVTDPQKWDIFSNAEVPGWTAEWVAGSGGGNDPQIELHAGVNGWTTSNNQYVELDTDWDGPNGSLSGEQASISLYQDIPTVPGYKYTLKWSFSARPNHSNNSLKVEIGSNEIFNSGNISGGGSINWEDKEYTFTANSSVTRVRFTETGIPDSYGMFLNDVSVECLGIPTTSVTVCKQDQHGNPLSGWKVGIAQPVGFDEQIPVTDGSGVNATVDSGAFVVFTSGTYRYGNSSMIADAGFSYRPIGIPYGNDGWVSGEDLISVPGALELKVNGENINHWGAYNASHQYTAYVPGFGGGNLNLAIWDDHYGDNANNGDFRARVSKSFASGLTGENGCKTFTDVPYGEYEVFEVITQNDWSYQSTTIGSDTTTDYPAIVTIGERVPEITITNHNSTLDQITIIATKIVCDSEADLPNWGYGAPNNITEITAQRWVNAHPTSCHLEEGWNFQWGDDSDLNPGDATVGEVAGWTTFGPTGVDGKATAIISDFGNTSQIKVREVLKENYIPFTYLTNNGNSDNVSAEIYCDTDVLNYDNDDRITNPQYGQTYYCVGFNAIKVGRVIGAKYNDLNVSGTRDTVGDTQDTEPGLNGWTIQLKNEAGDVIASTTTDSKGDYWFDNVAPGNYKVCEVSQIGWTNTDPVDASYCKNITVVSGQETLANFGNAQLGSIHGYKWDDRNGDGVKDISESLLSDWTVNLYKWNGTDYGATPVETMNTDGGVEHFGWYWFENLLPGQYKVCEFLQSGWNQTFPINQDGNCHVISLPSGNSNGFELPEMVNAIGGLVYAFGNQHLGTVNVTKYNDRDGSGTKNGGEEVLSGWTISLSDNSDEVTDQNGNVSFEDLTPNRDYTLSETMQEDWYQTNITCELSQQGPGEFITAPGEAYGHHGQCAGWNACGDAATCAQWACEVNGYSNLVSYGDQRPCTQFNNCNLFWSRGSVQMNWGNWCGVMGVTDIKCSNNTSITCGDSNKEVLGDNLEQFYNPFIRQVFAEVQDVVNPVDSKKITVNPGDVWNCSIGNRMRDPVLHIEKENDTGGAPQLIGNLVKYKIKVWVTKFELDGVKVVDLLPKGFKYVLGSWKAYDYNNNPLVIGEPNYASPGTWEVGTLEPDKPVTLEYYAEIQDEVDPGTYKDLAWTAGDSGEVLGLADTEGYISTNFVGTEVEVEVNAPTKDTVDVKETKEEEEVLGASDIRLPATGASTTIINMVLLMGLVGGLLMMIGGIGQMIKVRKKKVKNTRMKKALLTMLTVGFSLILASKVYAESDSKLVARIEEPKSPAISTFKLNFVVLDANETPRTIEAECWKKGPSDGDFVKFADADVDGTGGNTNNCDVNSSVLTQSGTYDFKVMVKAEGGNWQEAINRASVEYDNDGPDKPKYIEKDKKTDCRYEIKLKTADDGQTSYVKIYRDDDKDMNLHSGNLIKTKTIGPDEKYEFTYEVYGGDCGKTWYFAVIAFDDSGNASDPRAEELVNKVTVTKTETEEVLGALEIPGGANIPGIDETGEETSTQTGSESEDGSVLGEETQELGLGSKMIKSPWFWLLLIVLAYITARVIKNKNKKK